MTLGTSGPEVSRVGLGCMGMSGMYGPADRAREHRDDPRRARRRHHPARHRRLLRHGPQRAADRRGARGPRPRPGRDQRQVRRPARPGRRAGSATTRARSDQDRARLLAEPARTRLRRHLPPGAARSRTSRSRRPSAPSPSWSRPATSATSASPRSAPKTIRRAAAVHPICDLQIEYSLISRGIEDEILPTCRELGIGDHGLRRPLARSDQRPLVARARVSTAPISGAIRRASRAPTWSTTSRSSRPCARSPSARGVRRPDRDRLGARAARTSSR